MTKILLIADHPKTGKDVPFNRFASGDGLRFAHYLGVQPADMRATFEPIFLLRQKKWDIAKAREAAMRIKLRGRRTILCGLRVRNAFDLDEAPYFEWLYLRGGEVAVIPNPNSLNRFWNNDDNRSRACEFLLPYIQKADDPRKSECQLPMERLEEMWLAYLERQTIAHVQSKTGADPRTITRLIYHGDPVRGVEAFRDRFRKIVRAAAEIENKKIAEVRSNLQKMARGMAAIVWARINEVYNSAEEISKIPPHRLPEMLDKTARLLMYLYEQPDERVEVNIAPGPESLEKFGELLKLLPPEDKATVLRLLREGNGELKDAKTITLTADEFQETEGGGNCG